MNFRNVLKIAATAFLAVPVMSCKDKLQDVDLMMTGNPQIIIDDYVGVGTEHELEAGGITKPEEGVGYFWTVTPEVCEQNDTTDVFRFIFPDSVGTYVVTSVAFADDYYDRPSTKSVVVVDDTFNRTLNIGEVPGMKEFKDPRDGMIYRYVTIGSADWFISNLAYKACGIPYQEYDVMWNIFGGYYTFNEVETGDICPEGWRVPSDADWRNLMALTGQGAAANVDETESCTGLAPYLMVKAEFIGERMWPYDPDCDPNNKSGFSAAPVGYYSQNGFTGINEYAAFWTSDTYNDKPMYRYIYYEEPDVKVSTADRDSFRASVRCVRDI